MKCQNCQEDYYDLFRKQCRDNSVVIGTTNKFEQNGIPCDENRPVLLGNVYIYLGHGYPVLGVKIISTMIERKQYESGNVVETFSLTYVIILYNVYRNKTYVQSNIPELDDDNERDWKEGKLYCDLKSFYPVISHIITMKKNYLEQNFNDPIQIVLEKYSELEGLTFQTQSEFYITFLLDIPLHIKEKLKSDVKKEKENKTIIKFFATIISQDGTTQPNPFIKSESCIVTRKWNFLRYENDFKSIIKFKIHIHIDNKPIDFEQYGIKSLKMIIKSKGKFEII